MGIPICWFCGNRAASDSIEVPLYRGDVKVEQLTHKKRRVTWEGKTIYVPCCSRCKRAFFLGCLSKVTCVVIGLVVLGAVSATLAISSNLFDEPTIPFIAGVVCGVLAGYGVIQGFNFLNTRSVGNEGWKKDQYDYPDVVAAVEEGWTTGTPPEAQ